VTFKILCNADVIILDPPGEPNTINNFPSSLNLGITWPFLSQYMFFEAAIGAFSRKSKKYNYFFS
jgi:hypothetical protein